MLGTWVADPVSVMMMMMAHALLLYDVKLAHPMRNGTSVLASISIYILLVVWGKVAWHIFAHRTFSVSVVHSPVFKCLHKHRASARMRQLMSDT